MKRLVCILTILAAGVALAACGSSSKSTSTTKPSTSTTSTAPASASLTQGVVVTGQGPNAQYTPSTTAHPGQSVALRTEINAPPGTPGEPVSVSIDRGPGTTLHVTATAGGKSSTATIHSSSPIKLTSVNYGCFTPPTSTLCPAQHASGSTSSYHVKFQASRLEPVVLGAAVINAGAPETTAPKPGTSQQPPFKLNQQVRVEVRGGATPPYGSSATAHPGAILDLLTTVAAPQAAAPQTVHLSIDHGPSNTLHVTATTPGGPSSQATIHGANGKPISIKEPRWVCFVPPYPTFCPAKQAGATSSSYTYVFPAIPGIPIALFATAS